MRPITIKRGQLHFFKTNGIVLCTLGPGTDPESQFVFQVHESLLPDLIAGATAISMTRRRKKKSDPR